MHPQTMRSALVVQHKCSSMQEKRQNAGKWVFHLFCQQFMPSAFALSPLKTQYLLENN